MSLNDNGHKHGFHLARKGLLAGALGLTAVGCLLSPFSSPGSPALVSQQLPDLDEDGKPEFLHVVRDRSRGPVLRLSATNGGGHDHDVVGVGPVQALRFEPVARELRWRVMDEPDRQVAEIRLVQQAGRTVPDLIAFTAERAKRFVFVDRGFLKLDSFEIIPGFSAGLVMLGDRQDFLETLGSKIGADGLWTLPLADPLSLKVLIGADRRVERLTTDSSRLLARGALGVGNPVGALAKRWPGERRGDAWLSPRYGVVAHLNDDGRVAGVTVTRPWSDPKPPSR